MTGRPGDGNVTVVFTPSGVHADVAPGTSLLDAAGGQGRPRLDLRWARPVRALPGDALGGRVRQVGHHL